MSQALQDTLFSEAISMLQHYVDYESIGKKISAATRVKARRILAQAEKNKPC